LASCRSEPGTRAALAPPGDMRQNSPPPNSWVHPGSLVTPPLACQLEDGWSRKRVLFCFQLKHLVFDATKKKPEPSTNISRITRDTGHAQSREEGEIEKGEGCLSHPPDVREGCGLYMTSCRGRHWANTGGAMLCPSGYRDLELPPPEPGRCSQSPAPTPRMCEGDTRRQMGAGMAGYTWSWSEPKLVPETPGNIGEGGNRQPYVSNPAPLSMAKPRKQGELHFWRRPRGFG
jgi:hypothetical protein